MNQSDFDYVDDPAVAIANDGHVAVAWADQARKDVFFQMFARAGRARLPRPVNVSSSPGSFSWMPRLAMVSNDPRRVYVLWQEIVFSGGGHGGEIFVSRSTDGGATFSAPINISNSMAGDGKGRLTADRWDNGSLDLAVGPDGQLLAAWTEYEGILWVSSSTDGGLTFGKPVYVAGNANEPVRAPSLALGNAGTVLLAWSQTGQTTAGIRVATSADGGRSFGIPLIVPSSGHADAPRIAVDLQGNRHLVFGDSPTGLFGQYRIRYTRGSRSGERFTPPRTIASANGHALNFPNLSVDRLGRLYVTWQLFSGHGTHSRGMAFTTSRDGGESFAEAETMPGSDNPGFGVSGSQQGSLLTRLAVNADGALAIVNSTFSPERSSHIWLWRRPAL